MLQAEVKEDRGHEFNKCSIPTLYLMFFELAIVFELLKIELQSQRYAKSIYWESNDKMHSVEFQSYRSKAQKMVPLQKLQNLLEYVGVCAPPEGTASHVKFFYIVNGLILEFMLFLTILSNIFGAIQLFDEDLENGLRAIAQTIIIVTQFTTVLIFLPFRKNIRQIFLKLQQHYDESNFFPLKISSCFILIQLLN